MAYIVSETPPQVIPDREMTVLQTIRRWLGQTAEPVEEKADGGSPVATPPPGAAGDTDRETSTNAQVEGAVGQPYPDDS